MDRSFIRIHETDNVAVALEDIAKGTAVTVDGNEYIAKDDIKFGHKMALTDLKAGSIVTKYGCPIGHTTVDVVKGDWIHSHNTETNLSGVLEYSYEPVTPREKKTGILPDTFMGYRRADGRAATRNEIWVIPTVSCVNTTVNAIAKRAMEEFGDQCDGIFAYPHNAGCSQLGDDHDMTQKMLASIVHHPNAGGVLLVSLGCENNDFDHFKPVLGDYDPDRVKFMITQEVEVDEVEEGVRLIGEMMKSVAQDQREPLPVSDLKIAFKCGGSDAFSGITANPLCGTIAEKVTDLGGSAILTEVPEMFGAETQLMNRADSRETFDKVVDMINSFKQYYMDYNQPIYENPSPGNKAGGITTLEEKSLGCIQKGGLATVTDTLMFGDQCVKPGLNLATGPGNDSVSITDLLATGAQILLFTTGRGNPLGTAIPTIKVASNHKLASRKKSWIDFDAGIVLDRNSFDEASQELWEHVIKVASGEERTKSEEHGYKEIMIFKNGVIL